MCAGGFSTTRLTSRPTIIVASAASSVSAGVVVPTTSPRRITVMTSAISRTSFSLCVMKMMDLPWDLSVRMTTMSASASWGVRTAVGSSRMRISASWLSALRISTRCWVPIGRFSIVGVGVDVEAVLVGELDDALAWRCDGR